MGEMWRVQDTRLDHEAAIKVLSGRRTRNDRDRSGIRRRVPFTREPRT
jgi:hypothetical protein